ncbi:ARM repeat-containing protein [Testicularia cyperi]|uniref:ARM repeat-containing protein n=1 Tax=Testicularia cyperi TaxID=1882483 RepID=A0A317XN62_9BASI|nr:ARM repeat-containing protein [Testicularia cyperi]
MAPTATSTTTTTAAAGASTRRQALARLSLKGKLYVKGSSTDALLKRVKQVRLELSEMDQDAVDVKSLKPVCDELVSAELMLHKDKAVKANVACCLADMLRLFAPNAPFNPAQLRDIFQFFLHQLTLSNAGLSKPAGPQYPEYFYLLESLSNVKSIVLVCDLSNADDMMTDYFKGFLDLARPDMSKNVEICMADMLVQLIDECVSLPSDVLELLLANFTTKAIKHNPAAHRLAVEVCSNTKDRLQKYVAQYFNEVITSAVAEDDQDERINALQTAHSLILQINRVVPSLLLNVIPQLEEELRAEDVQLRILATKVLGQMFAEKSTNAAESGDLARRYAGTWRAWLGRANDKSSSLRVVWAEATKPLLVQHPELKSDLSPILSQKLLEPDERVRAAMAKTLGLLDYETALHHLDKSVLQTLADRCKDKRTLVRKEALESVGKLFDMAYSEIENHDPAAIQQFAWIPQEVFKCLYAGSTDMQQLVAETVEKHILPLPANPEEDEAAAWTNRLLVVMKYMEPEATKAMFRLTNLIYARPFILDHFIDCCEQYNGGDVAADKDGGVVRAMMADRIRRCAMLLGDPESAKDALHAFAKLNDARIYRLLRTCFDPQQDLKSLVKSRNDALRRIENASSSILPTMAALIRIGGFFILNRSSVPTLLKRLQQAPKKAAASAAAAAAAASSSSSSSQALAGNDSQFSEGGFGGSDTEAFRSSAQELLEFMAKRCPQMFAMHVPELCRALLADDTGSASNVVLTTVCLQALASVAQWNVSKVSLDKRTVERLSRYVLKGTPEQSKFAAKLLSIVATGGTRGGRKAAGQKPGAPGTSVSSTAAYGVLEETLDSLAKHLGTAKPERQAASLLALAQLFKHAPDTVENVADTVVKTILGDVLLKPLSPARAKAYRNGGQDWVEDSAVEHELQSKLLALTVLTKRCEAFADTDSADDMSKPIFRLLWAVIASGEARETLNTPPPAKSRMRLQAAICVLKLARHTVYDKCVGRQYFNLAFVVQDESFNVRSRLLHKLMTYLAQRRIDARYLAMAFLAAYDPEEENRNMVVRYCTSSKAQLQSEQRLKILDVNFPRFIHLLANHPDFTRENSDDIAGFVRYLDFFLDSLAGPSNLSLFYYLATRVKGVRDAESQGASENLYALSELAQLVIKRRAAQHGWSIESYPGKITLPGDIFKPLPSRDVQREIYDRQYLPQDLVQKLSQPTKHTAKKWTVSTSGLGSSATKKRKASSAKTKSSSAAKSRKKRRPSYEDDEDEEEESDEEDQDMDEDEEEQANGDNVDGNESSDLSDVE